MRFEPWHWVVLGATLMIAEMFVPTFFLLWFGISAMVVAALSLVLPMSFVVATLIWLGLSLVCAFCWVKFIQPHIKTRTKAGLGAGVIVGETGMIIKAPSVAQAGVIRFNTPKAGASEWACRYQGEEGLQVGERAVIVDILGNELLVTKK